MFVCICARLSVGCKFLNEILTRKTSVKYPLYSRLSVLFTCYVYLNDPHFEPKRVDSVN